MYNRNVAPRYGSPIGARPPPHQSHPPPLRTVNPYAQRRGPFQCQAMANPYDWSRDLEATNGVALVPRVVTAPRLPQPSWQLHRRDEPMLGLESQEVLQEHFSHFIPRDLEHESRLQLGIPTYEEPEVPDLDFDLWQRNADASLSTLGQSSFDFGSLTGNSFMPTEEESHVLGTSSSHEKKVMKAHEQFVRMLRAHKACEAFAMYDDTYDFQFYRIFQGEKTTAKRNAMNNIFGLWAKLFYHRLDGKPYQPSGFMVTLHLLFGELARRGVRYSLAKDFNYRGGFMKELELRWNRHKLSDNTFAARPTKVKMPEDYGQSIRAAVAQGLLDPYNDVSDCQLLFGCACGTMLGFRGIQVNDGLLIFSCCAIVRFL
jgi:hypothetical protein